MPESCLGRKRVLIPSQPPTTNHQPPTTMKSPFNRRDFLKASSLALPTVALSQYGLGCNTPPPAEAWPGFKFAMCNECMMDLPWAEQCRIMSEAGYTGVEIAAFTLVQESVNELNAEDRRELVRVMDANGLECVGLHWLFTPPPEGLHFTTPDAELRQRTVGYLDDLIDFCADLGGKVLIFGSPGQRSTTGGSTVDEAKQRLVEGLAQVGDHAQERGVKVLFETLDSGQTDVVNTMAESLDIVQRVAHPAIGTMFDYHNTLDETDSLEKLVRDYFPYIEHIQIQEIDGRHLGTGDARETFVDSFKALRELGYDKWISLEIFDFEPGGKVIAEESMEVLKALEASTSAA